MKKIMCNFILFIFVFTSLSYSYDIPSSFRKCKFYNSDNTIMEAYWSGAYDANGFANGRGIKLFNSYKDNAARFEGDVQHGRVTGQGVFIVKNFTVSPYGDVKDTFDYYSGTYENDELVSGTAKVNGIMMKCTGDGRGGTNCTNKPHESEKNLLMLLGAVTLASTFVLVSGRAFIKWFKSGYNNSSNTNLTKSEINDGCTKLANYSYSDYKNSICNEGNLSDSDCRNSFNDMKRDKIKFISDCRVGLQTQGYFNGLIAFYNQTIFF